MQSYRDLIAWQKSVDLVTEIYRITQSFPKTEQFGLCSQMQRAAVSIPSNIAEGHALRQTQAYLRHLAIASGSLAELETQLEISKRLGYLQPTDQILTERTNEVGRLVSGLRRSLRNPKP
jgi:four helix bundle protein